MLYCFKALKYDSKYTTLKNRLSFYWFKEDIVSLIQFSSLWQISIFYYPDNKQSVSYSITI